MRYQIDRKFTNQLIRIPIRTWGNARIVCKSYHYKKPNTYYFDISPTINGVDAFEVKIPKMPPSVIIDLYNDANGNMEKDDSIAVGKIQIKPIKMSFSVEKFMNKNTSKFANFSDDFAENAGVLSAKNSVYLSPDGKFRIDYKDVIRDNDGNELRTPARINSLTKIIEVAKKYYINYTVPGRKAINWHEFSHMYVNKDRTNEMEADKNAIMIYLSSGNPTVEAYNVFLEVFQNSPSNMNRARYDEINKFIKKFSNVLNNKQIN